MSSPEPDLRYDTAAMRAYAANLITVWTELRAGGMDRKEALTCVVALIHAIAESNKAK